MSLKLPDQPRILSVATIQTCSRGETAWIQIADEDEVEHPAPSVTLTAPADGGHE